MSFKRFQETEKPGGFSDTTEFNAKGLHLDKQILHVDDLVPNERLKAHAGESARGGEP